MSKPDGPRAAALRAMREQSFKDNQARERQERLLPDPARIEAAKAALIAPAAKPKPARRKK